ncbi:hypothetical protein GFB56_19650 [Ensifer sp. T173]|uniref:Uncharacterized protein n=1 Tax=Ensifer canadensis TaxID=555315 RepID=A0AAW4FNV8_9HYPH|nr:hypothetical protein [Ensifer canadensis]MBM3092997.1 hypothetical protein [Ensifer canadensis]UBI80439.1 hypothetical protein J3R84_36825 [Ensifer canadensis]
MRTFDSWISISGTIFSAVAAIAASAALYHSSQQVSLAREALKSNDRNQAFVTYLNEVGAFCESLDFSQGQNELEWSTFKNGARVKVFASYRFNMLVKKSNAAILLEASRKKYRAIQDAGISLQVWLDDGDYDAIFRAMDGLHREYLRRLQATAAAGDPQKYFELAALCYGMRDALIGWYKQCETPLSERIPTLSDVTVIVRPGAI